MNKKLACVLAGSMLLSACGKDDSKIDTKFDTTVFKDYFIKGRDFETLNYMNSAAADNTRVFNQCISGLLTTDNYGNLKGDMAESWEHNEDYTVWTFKIRDNAKWYTRDGKEYADVTAQDFLTSMEWVLTEENASVCAEMALTHLKNAEEFYKGEINDFSQVGIKAVDEKTVQYTLANPAPWFDTVVLYSSFYPTNAEFLKEKGTSFGNSPDTILYNGAYLITEYTNDTSKEYDANPNYWDAENVKVKKVTSIAVKDVESTKELFERGELSYCTLAGTQPTAEDRKNNPYMYQSDPVACSFVFFLNKSCTDENTAKAVQNENFRKAIFYGWDRTDYVRETDPLNPEKIFTFGYTPEGFVKNSKGEDFTQLGELKKWQTSQFDHEKGLEYLEKAKAELEKEGVTFPVAMPYYIKSGNETASNAAAILKDTLEEAFNGDITIDIQEYATTFTADVKAKNAHGIYGAGWIPDYQDPANQLGSIVPGDGGYMNNEGIEGYSHWEYPEFVEMYEAAFAEVTDLDKRYEMFANAEAYLLEHAYYIPLYRAGTEYKMTTFNPYTRTYSVTGGTEYRYNTIELADHVYTADEVASFKEEWLAKKNG